MVAFGGIADEVLDVAVDLRKRLPSFERWVSAEKMLALGSEWVAHAVLLVLSENADFLRSPTDYYAPIHESCIVWSDRCIGVTWFGGLHSQLFIKDQASMLLKQTTVFA